ncbi:hypothetical protein [Novosphingobium mathurense]|uniref:Uncharacterized protein n=1 Tax=Novosphingobium mathurense TaxID=428990 RepID=A0A1U6I6H5_9SPHN|nr:hypothetical protein [Novosphingobium mathurense]SLK03644.1 hypothetical protein SAMN06295987_104272 [Novosphingobium mathurense]
MRDDVAEIAKGLTKAQCKAVMSARKTFSGIVHVWHSHIDTIKSVHRKGLCTDPDGNRGYAIETPLGLAVRTYLLETDNGR